MRHPRHPANFIKVQLPVRLCGSDQGPTIWRKMQRLAQKMGKTEADIECRVTEMQHFVIEQNQLAAVHQDILRAEVTMNQCVGAAQCPPNKFFKKRRRLWHDGCGIFIVRLKSQRFKKLLVSENGCKFVAEPETFAMNRPE